MEKKQAKKIFIAVGVTLIVLFICLGLAYGVPSKDPVSSTLKRFFPAIRVGANVISVYDYEKALEVNQSFEQNQTRDQVIEKLIRDKKLKILAESAKTDHPTLEEELIFYTKNYSQDYKSFLQRYFSNNEASFKKLVVEPNVHEARLKITYYSSQTSSERYLKAKKLLSQIKSGEKFEDIAKKESQDQQSQQFGGDLGFFATGDLLPELEQAIKSQPLEKVSDTIVVSRFGYHLIYPIETTDKDGKKLWHAKHILIMGEGFDPWLDRELDKISVLKIVK